MAAVRAASPATGSMSREEPSGGIVLHVAKSLDKDCVVCVGMMRLAVLCHGVRVHSAIMSLFRDRSEGKSVILSLSYQSWPWASGDTRHTTMIWPRRIATISRLHSTRESIMSPRNKARRAPSQLRHLLLDFMISSPLYISPSPHSSRPNI